MTKRKDRKSPSQAAATVESSAANTDNLSSANAKSDKESRESGSKSEALVGGNRHYRDKSTSRESLNDEPRSSFLDSISAASGRNNWSGSKDIADYDPSISSIKGDSVSATIADYNRKHSYAHRASSDNQSRTSVCRLGNKVTDSAGEPSSSNRIDDSSVNINFYAPGSSTAGTFATDTTGGDRHQAHHHHHNHHRGKKHSKQRRTSNHHHHHHQQQDPNSRGRSSSATIEQASTLEFYDLPPATIYQIEPIVIRGNGNLILFGLSNSFNSEFPPALLGRVSREEFGRTISHINSLLRDQQSLSAKLLLIGSLFCCCSLGFSLVCPSIVLKQRCKMNLEKFLISENNRLYSKLGLNWKLGQRSYNRFVEHVIIIEFSPKIDPYMPD